MQNRLIKLLRAQDKICMAIELIREAVSGTHLEKRCEQTVIPTLEMCISKGNLN